MDLLKTIQKIDSGQRVEARRVEKPTAVKRNELSSRGEGHNENTPDLVKKKKKDKQTKKKIPIRKMTPEEITRNRQRIYRNEHQHLPFNPELRICRICEAQESDSPIRYDPRLNWELLPKHYEAHARMKYFIQNYGGGQETSGKPIQYFMPWRKEYGKEFKTSSFQEKLIDEGYLQNLEMIVKAVEEEKELQGIRPPKTLRKTIHRVPQPTPRRKPDEIDIFKKNLESPKNYTEKKDKAPLKCRENGKFCGQFQTQSMASAHWELYHGDRYRYKECTECSMRFFSHSDQRDHQTSHHDNLFNNSGSDEGDELEKKELSKNSRVRSEPSPKKRSVDEGVVLKQRRIHIYESASSESDEGPSTSKRRRAPQLQSDAEEDISGGNDSDLDSSFYCPAPPLEEPEMNKEEYLKQMLSFEIYYGNDSDDEDVESRRPFPSSINYCHIPNEKISLDNFESCPHCPKNFIGPDKKLNYQEYRCHLKMCLSKLLPYHKFENL